NAGLLDRNIQSSKIVHAALLLLMLEAVHSKTSFHHQPEAQHPKNLQLSTTRRPITPSLPRPKPDIGSRVLCLHAFKCQRSPLTSMDGVAASFFIRPGFFSRIAFVSNVSVSRAAAGHRRRNDPSERTDRAWLRADRTSARQPHSLQ